MSTSKNNKESYSLVEDGCNENDVVHWQCSRGGSALVEQSKHYIWMIRLHPPRQPISNLLIHFFKNGALAFHLFGSRYF